MTSQLKISICVPVYNNEPYLSLFLDSALQQTFQDYEIILAENHSTDHSMEILRKYEKAFPDKISVYQTTEHGGPGKGRNLAYEKSRGDYIYWCDGDDIIHPLALEKLYDEALKYNADVVCGSAFCVTERNGNVVKVISYAQKRTMQVSNETAIGFGVEFWMRLIKREIIEKMGSIPDDVILDDVRYITVLESYAENIRHLNFPVYYLFRRGSSTTTSITKQLCEDSINASKYILQHSNPKYIENVQHYVARRNSWALDDHWQFFDLFVNEAHEFKKWIYENREIKKNNNLYDKLRFADSLAERQFPNHVYIDGFTELPSEKRLAELKQSVFHDGCEVTVLTEKNCDLSENEYVKRAYECGNIEFVTGYFALRHIYKHGGIFLHNNIKILNYLSYFKYHNAFFALVDKNTYSDWIFGAPAGNEAIEAILKTYSDSWDKKQEYITFSERVSIILTAKYGIPQDGKSSTFGEVVSVFSPDQVVVDTRFGNSIKRCAFEHDFSCFAGNDGYITLPRSSLQALMESVSQRSVDKSRREIELKREMEELKSTNTWKLMIKIRKIGDGPYGPFLKKIFHTFLKIRSKLMTFYK